MSTDRRMGLVSGVAEGMWVSQGRWIAEVDERDVARGLADQEEC